MRTTLTLEDDVAVRLEQLKKKKHTSLKQLVNSTLRAGLDQIEKEHPAIEKRYVISSTKLGNKLPDLDNIAEILAIENEAGR